MTPPEEDSDGARLPFGAHEAEMGLELLAARLAPFLLDRELLTLALTHRSYCAENTGAKSNERLEFLGDAVLALTVTQLIYREHPALPEGDLARIRANVISEVALAPLAREMGIGAALRLGRGENNSGGREKPSLLADALEAVMGAIYIGSGIERAGEFITELTRATLDEVTARESFSDAKNRLQELAGKIGVEWPEYQTAQHGPVHRPHFESVVHFAGIVGRGDGGSKKEAERNAALAVLEAFNTSRA